MYSWIADISNKTGSGVTYDTCNPYMACSAESDDGFCGRSLPPLFGHLPPLPLFPSYQTEMPRWRSCEGARRCLGLQAGEHLQDLLDVQSERRRVRGS